MSNFSPRLGAAIALAARGRPVFPAGKNKTPLTKHGLLNATTDAAVLEAMWTRWPSANVAMVTGEPSGLVVLDIDGEEGAEMLAVLERRHGALPATRSVKTPRGGSHYYFRWPGVPVKTTAGLLAPGVDTRGDGGYVLVPPSRSLSGEYVWDCTDQPAAMPEWLVGITAVECPGQSVRTPSSVWTSMLRDGIPKGRRNVDLTRLAGHLLGIRILDVDVARELIYMVGERCKPPLPRADVDRIFESVAAMELRKP